MKLHVIALAGKADPKITELCEILNHSIFKKLESHYESSKRTLTINLKRLIWKKGKFLWFKQLVADEKDVVNCVLAIREVESYKIEDEHPDRIETKVSLGFDDKEIYLAASCEHGNGYFLSVKVTQINVTLEDL